MRNMYKFSAVLFIALQVISAQGVEAQRTTPKTNQNNPHYSTGKNDRYGKGQDPRRNDRGNEFYGNNRGNHGRDDLRIDPRKHGYGHFDRKVGYHFYGSQFYMLQHGRWIRANPSIGMHVQFIPYGTEVIHTRHGVIYRFGTVYFQKAHRRSGFTVINGPRRRSVW